jgi:oxygen-independent coproporphyrinogen III oxidase
MNVLGATAMAETGESEDMLAPHGSLAGEALDLGSRLRGLLAKYDSAAPRYTSYPPIPYWGPVDPATVADWLGAPRAAGEGSLSLYTHIPFCTSRCHYCGCFVVITPHQEPAERYLQAVHREMELVAERLGPHQPVRQYHLGGGTPNFISAEAMERLVAKARDRFRFEEGVEMSIEVDPRHLTPDSIRHLRGLGFTRLSLGIQDFDEQVQAGVNRVQPYAQVAALMDAARAAGFAGVNFDLIYGLPHQTRGRFARTVERVLTLAPDRLALYNFAYLPQAFPHQRKMDEPALPDPEEKLAIFLAARGLLTDSGYQAIGLDHFARHDDELARAYRAGTMRRNFMGYTTQAGTDLLAFGVSGISEFNGRFWQNQKKLVTYQRTVEAGHIPAVRGLLLDGEDLLRQAVVAGLFCQGVVDFQALGTRFGIEPRRHFAQELSELEPLRADGLVRLDRERLTVTETGQFFLRNIAVLFDHRTRKGAPVRFSRTV